MNGILNRINLMISRYLSNRLFIREHGILLGVMACMLVVGSFSAAFINTFLYSFASGTNSAGLNVVARYNLFSALYMVAFCALVGIVAKRITYRVSMAIGAALHILFYACVIIFMGNIQTHIGFVAMLSGISTAFFYIAYNSLVTAMIGNVARKQYVMFQSIISVACGIIFPLISGVIIYVINSIAGYMTVFAFCIIISAICLVLCFMVPKLRGQSKQTYFAGILIKSFSSGRYFAISICDCLLGLKEGIVMFLLPVIIIRLTENVFVVGFYVSVCTLATVLSGLLFQKINLVRYPYVTMFMAIFLQTVASAVLIFSLNIWTVFGFGVVNSLLSTLCFAPINAQYYNVLESVGKNLTKKTLETTCTKEIYYNLGKIIAILFLGITITNTTGIFVLITAFFMLQFITWGTCVALRKAEGGEERV